MISEVEKDVLIHQAKDVLAKNWENIDSESGYTKPSEKIYPFQWNWDAGFIAYAYTHYDLDKAVKEYRALFKGQWENGFLPHIVFHKNSDTYFPDPPFWREGWDIERDPETSGITQPPIHAMAIWHIYKAIKRKDEKRAIDFLKEFYPKLFNLHKYFMENRDPEKSGAITIYHPWESGLDNSPRWDVPLSKVEPKNLIQYKRLDIDYVDPKYRPSDETYDKFVYLVQNLREKKYNDEEIYKDHEFKVKDVLTSCVMYIGNDRLKKMAEVLKEDTSEIEEWMMRFETNFRSIFKAKDGFFYDYDLISKQKIKVRTAASLIPIITGLLLEDEWNLFTKEIVEDGLVPSTDEDDPKYNPELYWRGPIWINVNWLIWKGCLEHGLGLDVHSLKEKMVELVKENGFFEYFHPETKKGIGADNFSWTAALIIDILNHEIGY
jgi:hypothetical protein